MESYKNVKAMNLGSVNGFCEHQQRGKIDERFKNRRQLIVSGGDSCIFDDQCKSVFVDCSWRK